MASLKAKIYASASANAGLQALLGTNPFQFGDTQLPQEWDVKTKAAVVMFTVSDIPDYIAPGPMFTSWARVQLTVFGHGNDSENANAVVNAIGSWLLTLCLTQTPNQAANYIAGNRDGGLAQTQPLTYQRFVDLMLFYDSSI
jgi:hypothetical protein